MAEETQKVQNNIENVAANEVNLDAKIEKKKVELIIINKKSSTKMKCHCRLSWIEIKRDSGH